VVTPAEAAQILGVDQNTVTQWAKVGVIKWVRVVGDEQRYLESEVRALLTDIPQQRQPPTPE